MLHALSRRGTLQSEVSLASGRRPDVALKIGELKITADITAVSDDGLNMANPYHELSQLIEQAKTKLGFPIGGVDLQVNSAREVTRRGARTTLRLPPRRRLHAFVRDKIVPRLREHQRSGDASLEFVIEDEGVGLVVSIDPAKSPYSSGGFAAYDVPRIKDKNPLYNALRDKAGQLRGAPGVVGVIVGDGDCRAMAERPSMWDGVSADDIVGEFFRQYSSVDFVFLLSVREEQKLWRATRPDRRNYGKLIVRPGCSAAESLQELFRNAMNDLPTPLMTPVNGALRAREVGYGMGFHGGYSMHGGKLRVSLRELAEVLAGIRTFSDGGALNVNAARKLAPEADTVQRIFLQRLREGRLPRSVTIVPAGEDESDDWAEIEFGDPDPAISLLR